MLVVDGAVDLPPGLAESAGIRVVAAGVYAGQQPFSGGVEEFWAKLRAGESFSTTPPSVNALVEAYRQPAPVCALHVSGELSATLSRATEAARRAGGQVAVVDSHSFSVGTGLVAARLLEQEDRASEGTSIAEAAGRLVHRLYTFVLVHDLKILLRSGRSGLLPSTTLSHRRPLLLSVRGRVLALDQPRDRAGAIRKLAQRAREATGPAPSAWALGHGAATDLAEVREMLTKAFGFSPAFEVPLDPSVGAHVGPESIVLGVLA
jgi:DegV family protein with EDD domain